MEMGFQPSSSDRANRFAFSLLRRTSPLLLIDPIAYLAANDRKKR
jgi:hypothetical protein